MREEKKQFVKDFEEEIQSSESIVVTNYQGIDANTVNVLRKELKEADCILKVIKNRLARKSFENTDAEKHEKVIQQLKGPVAVILSSQDPSAGLKVFKKYSEENEIMSFKAGIIGDAFFDSEKLNKLAELPVREVLIGQVVNVFNAPLQNIHNVLSGIIKKLIYALKDLQEKKPEEEKPEEKKQVEEKPAAEEQSGEKQEEKKQVEEKPAAEEQSGEKQEEKKQVEEKPAAEEQSDEKPEEKKQADREQTGETKDKQKTAGEQKDGEKTSEKETQQQSSGEKEEATEGGEEKDIKKEKPASEKEEE